MVQRTSPLHALSRWRGRWAPVLRLLPVGPPHAVRADDSGPAASPAVASWAVRSSWPPLTPCRKSGILRRVATRSALLANRPRPGERVRQAVFERTLSARIRAARGPSRCRPASRARRRRGHPCRPARPCCRRCAFIVRRSSFSEIRPPVATLITSPAAPRRLDGAEHAVHDVGDVGEVARLLAVAVDHRLPALEQRRGEQRDDARVRRPRILSRPEHVEVADGHRLEAVEAREHLAVLLGDQLLQRVGRQRRRSACPRASGSVGVSP